MPFLKLDLDAKKNIPRVAMACGSDAKTILWGLMELWEWCWTNDLDGVHEDHLAGFFGLDGEIVGGPLALFGFLDAKDSDGFFRVRGAETYLGIKAQRSEAGKARAKKAPRTGGRFVKQPTADQRHASEKPAADQLFHPAPSTQHPIPREKLLAGKKPPAGEVAQDSTWKPFVEKLYAVWAELRDGKPHPLEADWAALRALRKRVGDDGLILERWRFGLGAEFKQRCDTFRDLNSRFDALVGGGTKPKLAGEFVPPRKAYETDAHGNLVLPELP